MANERIFKPSHIMKFLIKLITNIGTIIKVIKAFFYLRQQIYIFKSIFRKWLLFDICKFRFFKNQLYIYVLDAIEKVLAYFFPLANGPQNIRLDNDKVCMNLVLFSQHNF